MIEGKNSQIFLNKKILVENNAIKTSLKIKNVGDKRTTVYSGFIPYTKNGDILLARNYPYKEDSKPLEIISVDAEKGEILVNSYPEQWVKLNYVALHAKEDFSDVPNVDLLPTTILNVEKKENGYGLIKMNAPLDKSKLKVGDKIRIHGTPSGYTYPSSKVLDPGEEIILESSVKKDDELHFFSNKVFSHGVYCVQPIVLSYTSGSDEKNMIQIDDYSISY